MRPSSSSAIARDGRTMQLDLERNGMAAQRTAIGSRGQIPLAGFGAAPHRSKGASAIDCFLSRSLARSVRPSPTQSRRGRHVTHQRRHLPHDADLASASAHGGSAPAVQRPRPHHFRPTFQRQHMSPPERKALLPAPSRPIGRSDARSSAWTWMHPLPHLRGNAPRIAHGRKA